MIQVYTYISLLILLVVPKTVITQDVVLTEKRERNAFGIPCTEFYFDITVPPIPARKVIVRRFLPKGKSEGNVLLTAGGTGGGFYSATYGKQSQIFIDSLLQNDIAVWDIMYDEPNGWSENCEGIGSYHKAVEIYAVLVKFLYNNHFENTDKVFATGNSGGSFQIAFALAEFDLDFIFDMVVLTGGPPISELKDAIFGDKSLVHRWPTGVAGGFRLTDFLMGWTEEKYCANRSAPDSIMNALDTVSLVSTTESRNYNYSTFVNFVQSDDPTRANHQGRLYYNVIESEKAWYELDTVDIHAIPKSIEGSELTLKLILDYVKSNTTSVDRAVEESTYFYPLPFGSEITVVSSEEIKNIKIFNLKGELIDEFSTDLFNTSTWPKGIYIAKIYFNDGISISKKIIK